ncbi:MAG: polyphosphate kinase 2 [Thermoleophilia bacterium]
MARIDKDVYEAELERMQLELVDMQEAIRQEGLRLAILFEGRDTAGKGGTISRITAHLNPRHYDVVALGVPTETEQGQWYFQRYVDRLPTRGGISLFDRSWYNRAGVERVMGYCTEEQAESFLRAVPDFERMLVEDGLILVKYWLEVSPDQQEKRFQERATDPAKRWKLSPVDAEARNRYDDYTAARDEMLRRSDSAACPWYVVDADDQKRARLNLMQHLLDLVPDRRAAKKVRLGKVKTPGSPAAPPVTVARVPARW